MRQPVFGWLQKLAPQVTRNLVGRRSRAKLGDKRCPVVEVTRRERRGTCLPEAGKRDLISTKDELHVPKEMLAAIIEHPILEAFEGVALRQHALIISQAHRAGLNRLPSGWQPKPGKKARGADDEKG